MSQSRHKKAVKSSSFQLILNWLWEHKLVLAILALILSGATLAIVFQKDAMPLEKDDPLKDLPPECGNFTAAVKMPHAKVIGIGENHQDRVSTTACAMAIMKADPRRKTILFESIIRGKKVDCKQLEVKIPDAVCIGWDDAKEVELLYKLYFKEEYTQELKELKARYKNTGNEKDFEQYLSQRFARTLSNKKLLKQYGPFEEEKVNENTPLEMTFQKAAGRHQALIDIQTWRGQGKSFKTIFADERKYFQFFADREHAKRQVESSWASNKSLLQAVKEHQHDLPIVIAGKFHFFIPDKKPKEYRETAEYVQQELARGKDQTPYLILLTKS